MEVPPSFVRQPQSSKTGNTACHHKSQRPPHGVEHTRPRDITKQERIEAIAKFSEAHETYEHAKSSITTWKERGSKSGADRRSTAWHATSTAQLLRICGQNNPLPVRSPQSSGVNTRQQRLAMREQGAPRMPSVIRIEALREAQDPTRKLPIAAAESLVSAAALVERAEPSRAGAAPNVRAAQMCPLCIRR